MHGVEVPLISEVGIVGSEEGLVNETGFRIHDRRMAGKKAGRGIDIHSGIALDFIHQREVDKALPKIISLVAENRFSLWEILTYACRSELLKNVTQGGNVDGCRAT